MTFIVITADHAQLRKVRRRLRRKGYQAYLPAIVQKRIVLKGAKARHARRIVPLMSYIMVQSPGEFADAIWLYDVLSTKDVRGYVRSGDVPAYVSLGAVLSLKIEVAKLRRRMDATRQRGRLRRGAKAAIKSGSLAGKAGTVAWVRGQKAGLEAKLFGSMRVVEVAADNLEAA